MNWEANLLSTTYEDTMTVYAYDKNVDEKDGFTYRSRNPICRDVPCALSKKNMPSTIGDGKGIIVQHVVFCGREVPIKRGYEIELTRFGNVYNFVVVDFFDYLSHKEINVSYKERI